MVTSSTTLAARRDPEQTKARILDALGRIILREGLAAVGVNALAREAGADKVLIYRYFGDLDGVYAAFAERTDFWWTCAEITEGLEAVAPTLADALKLCLRRHALAIRRRPLTLAVLAAELAGRTPLVVALEAVRERRALELAGWIGRRYPAPDGVDLDAMSVILSSGVTYLAVRARTIRVMSGVTIKTDDDWARLLAALDRLVDGALA